MMEENALNIHDKVLLFLLEERKKNQNLRFTLRKSDKGNRLSKGYWFYGNESYVALSFWSGTDWKNRTPNIIFVISAEDESTYLEITTSDSEDKRRFIYETVQNAVPELYLDGVKYYKRYSEANYMDSLVNFLNSDKLLIDSCVENTNLFGFELDLENKIGFISEETFNFRLEKTLGYREKKEKANFKIYPNRLKSIDIKGYAGVINLNIDNLPLNNQWIFLTGLNGSGKTTILRAIAISLCENLEEIISIENENYEIKTEIQTGPDVTTILSTPHFIPSLKHGDLPKGFAAYGASRLVIENDELKEELEPDTILKRTNVGYSIFHHNGIFFDFSKELTRLLKDINEIEIKEKLEIIADTLVECIEGLEGIYFVQEGQDILEDKGITKYIEKDEFGKRYESVEYDKLSSGTRSLIAMIGDMMVRLFSAQPNIYDIGELTGIVLIDEIDLHFHPKQQKSLVEALTESFPKVQFIVTTHSPIPLLGAPKDTVIFNVKRSVELGVVAERIDTLLNFYELMPNAILTSPIFGLQSLISSENKEHKTIKTEDTWREIKLNQGVKKELEEIYKRLGTNNDEIR